MSNSELIRVQKYTNIPEYLKNNFFARQKPTSTPQSTEDMVELLFPTEHTPPYTNLTTKNLLSFSSRLASVFISKPFSEETTPPIKTTEVGTDLSQEPGAEKQLGHPAFGKIVATNYIEKEGVFVPILEAEGMTRKKTMFIFKPDDNMYYNVYGFQSEPGSDEIKFVLSRERVKREYQMRPNEKLVYKKRMVFNKSDFTLKAWDTIIMKSTKSNNWKSLDDNSNINMEYIHSEVEREYGILDTKTKTEKETAMITMYHQLWKTLKRFN